MKRLLMLGGADIQISAIKKAKELGHYVITCDYLPNNPGHAFSDEYHDVSTTDKEAVLELAKSLNIDGVSAYASDPGALTAAFLSDHLDLPGNSFEQVKTLSDKYEFRSIQHAVGIPAPRMWDIENAQDLVECVGQSEDGVIVKPADTSGSKGVFTVKKTGMDLEYLETKIHEAKDFSRSKRIVAEEFLLRDGFLMSGDFIVVDGKIEFYCFGDVHFNECVNGLVPRSISLPATHNKAVQQTAIDDIQKVIDHLAIKTGVFNMDVIKTLDDRVVCIDIGARNGGNMFNDIIHWHSGVDLIELGVRQCLDEPLDIPESQELMFCAHNVIHSAETGILESIEYSDVLKKKIRYEKLIVKPGDKIHRFEHSGYRCGLLLLEFSSFQEMHDILGRIHKHVVLKLR